MKVLHVIPSLSPKHGGPSVALPMIVRALSLQGVCTTVATTDDDGPGGRVDVPLETAIPTDGVKSETIHFRKATEFYKFSPGMKRWLRAKVTDFDVVHVHALFSHTSIAAGRAAQRAGIPYIVRPLGVLNRWGVENRRALLKRVSLQFVELPLLRLAAAIHYTSAQERTEALEVSPQLAEVCTAVIPLPVQMGPTPGDGARFRIQFPQVQQRRMILFLSRIDRKKGIDLLLRAYAELRRRAADTVLVIAGMGEQRYVRELRQLASAIGLDEQSVLWTGQLAGEAKWDAFAAASVFVLPSHSENFGIAAAEALAAGTPVVLADGVAISADVREAGAGVVVRAHPEEVAAGVLRILDDKTAADQMAACGCKLVAERFSLDAVGAQLHQLYQSVRKR